MIFRLLLFALILPGAGHAQLAATAVGPTSHYVDGDFDSVNPGTFFSYRAGRVVWTAGLVDNSVGSKSIFLGGGIASSWGPAEARLVLAVASGYSTGLPAGITPTSVQSLSVGRQLRLTIFHLPGAVGVGLTLALEPP